MPPSPLVVGLDMSHESASALTAALHLARDLGRGVAVVHAVGLLEEGGYRPPPAVAELVADARRDAGVGDDVEVDVVREDGPAADVLLRVAARLGAAMIVVGRRGLGAAPRPLGSVSEAVLARAESPVLVIPGSRPE
jgi:nucleotide-binding universal stress UspA family protein